MTGAPSLTISIIIPVHNDPGGLRDTVESLMGQTFDPDQYEVIVVDNRSTDDTNAVARALAARYPGRVVVLQEMEVASSYAARNRGLEVARGELVCFVDADMTAPAEYLARVYDRFAAGDVDYLGCRVELYATRATWAARYNCAYGFRIDRNLRELHFAPTCCLCVRRAVIERVGGFDARLESGGDLEFGQRAYLAGVRQGFAADVVLRHPARASYRALLAKSRRVARGHAQLRHHFPDRFGALYRAQLRGRRFIPKRPWKVKREFEARAQSITWLEACFFSLFPLPLHAGSVVALVRESRRLRRLADGIPAANPARV